MWNWRGELKTKALQDLLVGTEMTLPFMDADALRRAIEALECNVQTPPWRKRFLGGGWEEFNHHDVTARLSTRCRIAHDKKT